MPVGASYEVTPRHHHAVTGASMRNVSEEQRREFGRDGVSGLVDPARALRARLLPRRTAPRGERTAPAPERR